MIHLERTGHQPLAWLSGPMLLALVVLFAAVPAALWFALYFVGSRLVMSRNNR